MSQASEVWTGSSMGWDYKLGFNGSANFKRVALAVYASIAATYHHGKKMTRGLSLMGVMNLN